MCGQRIGFAFDENLVKALKKQQLREMERRWRAGVSGGAFGETVKP